METTWIPCLFSEIPHGEILVENYNRNVIWETTSRCNLSCRHCYYQKQLEKEPGEDLDNETIVDIVRNLVPMGFDNVQLLGGEPFLRPNVLTVVEEMKNCGVKNVLLNSNGVLLDDEKAEKIAELGILPMISIDGPVKINDKMRGKGTFASALKAIMALSSYSAGPETYTVVTKWLARLDYHQIESYIQLLSEAGVKAVNFGKLITKHLSALEEFAPSAEELYVFSSFLLRNKEELERRYDVEVCLDEGLFFPIHVMDNAQEQELIRGEYDKFFASDVVRCSTLGCTAGRKNLVIDPKGYLIDCVFNRKKFGNLKTDSVFQAVKDLVTEFCTPPYERCISCRYQPVCGGACRLLEIHGRLAEENIDEKLVLTEEERETFINNITVC
ncbi:MAG: hypothetical protein AYK19_05235 [Theionarchaea archaeon DG-70-1]|nr:MAG: hypothetical protein AYK19_05235 [Theionarchaea archaeon DG-70-1]